MTMEYRNALQVLVEPRHGLAESLLLGELEVLVAQVGAHGESVGDAAEEVDLPGLGGLDQDALGLVAELGGEDLVDFYRRKSQSRRVTKPKKTTKTQQHSRTYRPQQWTEEW